MTPSMRAGEAPISVARLWRTCRDEEPGRAWPLHPVVQAHVSLAAFGDLTPVLDAVLAEARARTAAGDRIVVLARGSGLPEAALAGELAGRDVALAMTAGEDATDEAAGAVPRTDLESEDRGAAQAVISFTSLGLADDPPARIHCAAACLRPGGHLLAIEWLADSAARRPSPEWLGRARAAAAVAPSPAPPIAGVELSMFEDAGLEIAGHADGGCALVWAALGGVSAASFDPASWQHNHRLASLFALEQEAAAAGLQGRLALLIAHRR